MDPMKKGILNIKLASSPRLGDNNGQNQPNHHCLDNRTKRILVVNPITLLEPFSN
jgi:hypothetical protein